MKSVNSHFLKAKLYGNHLNIPKNPRVILMGSPNVDLKLFAHRIAIDFGVSALSLKQMYKTILAYEGFYSNATFYRKVISILKNPNLKESIAELENDNIPEKLLSLTKYSEKGYILYDYPTNLTQAKNLEENSHGGINLALNLMLNKEIAKEREQSKYVYAGCSCDRTYYKNDVINKDKKFYLKNNFPENGICGECGSNDISHCNDEGKFEEDFESYERQLLEVGPFYQTLGLLNNFEVKNGLEDYESIRRSILNNIKH
jgi:adenylate kinase family enzyme